MSDWCIRHKTTVAECADRHRIEDLERQIAMSEVVLSVAESYTEGFEEGATLAAKIDTVCTENVRLNAIRNELRGLLRLPILFYKVGPFDEADIDEWEAATGSREVTNKVMCDAIRRGLGEKVANPAPACCGLYAADGVHSPGCPNAEKGG